MSNYSLQNLLEW